jgi:hypothetical protein
MSHRQMLTVARAEALFASDLSAGEAHPATELRDAITTTVRRYGGVAGCAEQMAQEYGDHPDQAAQRMQWATGAVRSLTGQRGGEGGSR